MQDFVHQPSTETPKQALRSSGLMAYRACKQNAIDPHASPYQIRNPMPYILLALQGTMGHDDGNPVVDGGPPKP